MLIVVNVALVAACVKHGVARVKTHSGSPGVVTGILLYIPLLIIEASFYLRSSRAPLWAGALAALVGGPSGPMQLIEPPLGYCRQIACPGVN